MIRKRRIRRRDTLRKGTRRGTLLRMATLPRGIRRTRLSTRHHLLNNHIGDPAAWKAELTEGRSVVVAFSAIVFLVQGFAGLMCTVKDRGARDLRTMEEMGGAVIRGRWRSVGEPKVTVGDKEEETELNVQATGGNDSVSVNETKGKNGAVLKSQGIQTKERNLGPKKDAEAGTASSPCPEHDGEILSNDGEDQTVRRSTREKMPPGWLMPYKY